ncbi:hypothetical protein [Staphylothermus hellenicus]|uniref:Uncharacterized protein n=1 Tax=Staphylothermus hellenicus (strain DSM 12710 / JCM 10830 / BK20S6-10-b1 / P8) TaxID=591019 RepID=D7DBS7_STAHD|nr:hypothetical protein [Staphylothermus hellenicus]ADI31624.1 hypothetical protein Shell_0493 [Staphylothermus hellenicus DSM 12710]
MDDLSRSQNLSSQNCNLFMDTAVISDNKPVSEKSEIACVISKAFNIAAKDHIKLELTSIIVGIILLVFSIFLLILGGVGVIDLAAGLIGIVVLACIGAFIILYGLFIHKPDEISMLSKVYVVSHLIPYKPGSALLFDGTGIIPEQVMEYKDIPLAKIKELSSKLPSSPISYKNETALVDILDQIKQLTGKIKKYQFKAPVVPNSNLYVNAVLDSLPYCVKGAPLRNPLGTKISIQDAVQYRQEIERLEEGKEAIDTMNEVKNTITHKSKPFIDNLIKCLNDIDSYISNIAELLRERFINGFNIHADPKADAEYGYEYVNSKYHIKVGSSENKNISNPINTFQRVIDYFDESIRREIGRIRKDGERRIKERKERAESEERLIRQNYDLQIESKKSEKSTYEKQAENAYREYRSSYNQYKSYLEEARRARSGEYPDYEKAQHYEEMAQYYKMQADEYYSQYEDAESRAEALENIINKLESRKKREIKQIRDKASRDIASIKEEIKNEILDLRKFINEIIEKRNTQIEMFEKIYNTLLSSEKELQSAPFNNRKNTIMELQSSIFSVLDDRIKERSKVLQQIGSFKINIDMQKPTSIYIPFWIIIVKRKKGPETIIFPPLKIIHPSETSKSRWKFVEFTAPLSNALEKFTDYLKTDWIINEAKTASILGKIDHQVASEIDRLVSRGFFGQGYADRIKKYYGLIPVGGEK